MSPETEMDNYEAYAFQGFVYDAGKFNETLRKSEPSAFTNASDSSVFHAGEVCDAMKASAGNSHDLYRR